MWKLRCCTIDCFFFLVVILFSRFFFLHFLLYRSSFSIFKAPAKRSQHVNATYRNIVGRNMLRAFGHCVATCCEVLDVVGSDLKVVKIDPTTPNMSQHGGQTHTTCCAQQYWDMLRWHVAIVWPGLNTSYYSLECIKHFGFLLPVWLC